MPPLLRLQKWPGKGDGGWEKSVFVSSVSSFGWPEDPEFVERKKEKKRSVLGHPIARATGYCLLPDTFWLWASKVGSVKFANSLSPPSTVKKVRTGSKRSQVPSRPTMLGTFGQWLIIFSVYFGQFLAMIIYHLYFHYPLAIVNYLTFQLWFGFGNGYFSFKVSCILVTCC